MATNRAVVWLDHHEARVLSFDAENVESRRVTASTHNTRQHGSAVRTGHEYLADVCAALDGIGAVLITGGKTSLADMNHYAQKHRPETAGRIVGYEVVDHPSDNQLLALARNYFLRHDRMTGTPTPS